ncbi:hypothetical protein NUW58_g6175 [Xylaria curta]|uniref:Uncharacterized protein n=1 Tax=Xylaria curta TaxID=42375 RepID=A0ACC1NY82_9PEZI|nr:hypothetical protein NUW58_g6175 [Xylaria curta]
MSRAVCSLASRLTLRQLWLETRDVIGHFKNRRQATESHVSTTKMKHLAAYLLLGLGGNTSPSASDIKKVLDSVGIEADDDRLKTLISELKGKDINEVRPHG